MTRAALVVALLVFALTWPQVLYPATRFVSHVDPPFSIWRLAWIGHALATDPHHLFDANIFHPARGTLAYSDATLLEGAIGAPLFWVGVPSVLVYNLLLFAGFIGSGMAMFVLARHLTRSDGAGLVAAAIFALVPYRIEHFAHLELQWAMWIPLAFWAIHRTVEERSWRFGALAGVFLWLQILSCVYYGVFLAIAMPFLSLVLAATMPRRGATAARLLFGAAVAALLAVPYLLPYLAAARELRPRDAEEVIRYSAEPINYLASPAANWIAAWTSERFGAPELILYPGVVAVTLSFAAVLRSPRALVWTYVAVGALALDVSFGARVPFNAWVIAHVPGLNGLRGWGRSAIVVYCALAVLAAFAVARLERVASGSPARRRAIVGALIILIFVDYRSGTMPLTDPPQEPAVLYSAIRDLPPGVLLELPVPAPETLPGPSAIYMLWSTRHWQRLVNGYSGYYPRTYPDTLRRLGRFPDDRSIAASRALGVQYIALHRGFYPANEYETVVDLALHRPELVPRGRYDEKNNEAMLFELKP